MFIVSAVGLAGYVGFVAAVVLCRRKRREIARMRSRAEGAEAAQRRMAHHYREKEQELLHPLVRKLVKCERERHTWEPGRRFCIRTECDERVIQAAFGWGDMNGAVEAMSHAVAANWARAVYGINALREA